MNLKNKILLLYIFICFPLSADSPWTQLDDFDGPNRIGAVSFTIGDKGYIVTGDIAGGQYLNDFWEYDPSKDDYATSVDEPNEVQEAHTYEVTFDASNLPSGLYIYRLEADNFVESKKMLFIK